MSDPRHRVYGVHPDPDRAIYARRSSWDSQWQRWTVRALGTQPLGHIYLAPVNAHGDPVAPRPPQAGIWPNSVPAECLPARHEYRATTCDGVDLGQSPDIEYATALIVGAAHSEDPAPEHVVPRNRVGRPPIGVPVQVRLGDLLPAVDERAEREGVTRAEMVRRLVAAGLDQQ